jgi:hypothetical protein
MPHSFNSFTTVSREYSFLYSIAQSFHFRKIDEPAVIYCHHSGVKPNDGVGKTHLQKVNLQANDEGCKKYRYIGSGLTSNTKSFLKQYNWFLTRVQNRIRSPIAY